MQFENIGGFGVLFGVIGRFWPVWIALAIVLFASFTWRKRLGLYGQLFDSGVGIAGDQREAERQRSGQQCK